MTKTLARSHTHLPKDEQRVEIFLYIIKFSKEQAEEMSWDSGRLSNPGQTSDEMIFEIANRKNNMLNMLLKLMKETAMDCKVHLDVHKKTEPDLECLSS